MEFRITDNLIITCLNKIIIEVDEALEKYNFGEVSKTLYDFIWSEYCDWYIELIKARLYQDEDPVAKKTAQYVGVIVLEKILCLLHPVMPFITEEIGRASCRERVVLHVGAMSCS